MDNKDLLVDPRCERQLVEDLLEETKDVGIVLAGHLCGESTTLIEATNVHVERLVIASIDEHATRAREHVPA